MADFDLNKLIEGLEPRKRAKLLESFTQLLKEVVQPEKMDQNGNVAHKQFVVRGDVVFSTPSKSNSSNIYPR